MDSNRMVAPSSRHVVVCALIVATSSASADDAPRRGSEAAAPSPTATSPDVTVKPAAAPPNPAAVPAETAVTTRTTAMCIDQEIADRLAVKRKRRGAVDREVVKQGRHEITLAGGYNASDLLSGTYIVGGSYTYHMTDETAVEFAGWWTHANADIIRALEDRRGVVLANTYESIRFAESLLVWSPVYGKLRMGGTILHFDLHGDLGVGVIDSNTSRGVAGIIGFGMKLFMSQAIVLRIDARNRTFREDLLDQRFLVNDSAVTAGFSVLLPFTN